MNSLFDTVVSILQAKKLPLYRERLNIVGMRRKSVVLDQYNDYICLIFAEKDTWACRIYTATTLPGKYWLIDKLMNPKGALILAPGRYEGAFRLGKHKGKYDALVQNNPFKVYRDKNRDKVIDYNALEYGMFGVNIHKAEGLSDKIGRNSAGCQVIKYEEDYKEFMSICIEHSKKQNAFDYVLLEY